MSLVFQNSTHERHETRDDGITCQAKASLQTSVLTSPCFQNTDLRAEQEVVRNMSDQHVYVKDKEHHWVPGLLVEQSGDTAKVKVGKYATEQEITGETPMGSNTKTVKVKLKDYPHKALPLQNVVEGGKIKIVQDMIELGYLHEAAILYNLKDRHSRSMPYTRTGDIVIALNPYKWIKELYTEENRLKYSRSLVWEASKKNYDPRQDLPPHVYETSALAYKGLALLGQHQSILVSGESGAGKTETVKICMNHLASVVQSQSGSGGVEVDDGVITRVVDSNPLLEAFGNAKTRRNDNSSRFGKYIQLQFKQGSSCTLAGSICDVYLLEKSRVVRHDDEERTFHIFYQLLTAADDIKGQFWEHLKGKDIQDFAYVGATDTTKIEGKTDADHFDHTLKSLAIVNIVGEELNTFIQGICVVLQLGNIIFGESPKDSDHAVITSSSELSFLSEIMGIDQKSIEYALLHRKVRVRNEETVVHLKEEAAKEATDALAKQIYDRLFAWLVARINVATTAGEDDFGIIGLLDIFGFESFPVNSFEQLCINFANERLQAKFTKDVFSTVLEEYESEGLSLDDIAFDDNTDVLDLIQNKTGLLAMLNEECIRPNGSDAGFVNKASHSNKSSKAFMKIKIKQSDLHFGIHHYAGDVIYDATDFVTKNQDTLPEDLLQVALTSTNSIIAQNLDSRQNSEKASKSLQGRKAPGRGRSALVSPTAWTKYSNQLKALMKNLEKSTSRYIRCIKPNSLKKPTILEHKMTLGQLRSSGVIAAVTLARSAFPNRLEHDLILQRFFALRPKDRKPISLEKLESREDVKKECEQLLDYALRSEAKDGTRAFVMGKTRAYFRGGALEFLESERLRGMEPAAIKLQATARVFLAKQMAYRLKHKEEIERKEREEKERLERLEREEMERLQREAEMGKAAVVIQCLARAVAARKEREKRYVRHIKEKAKQIKREKKQRKLGKAATVIQKYSRRTIVQQRYRLVFEKVGERRALKVKQEKIRKKTEKLQSRLKKEIQRIEKGDPADIPDAEAESSKLVELLQSEFKKLQVKQKTLEGMTKPLKKNLETLMKENESLREEYQSVQDKNKAIKAATEDFGRRQREAEQKTIQVQEEIQYLANRSNPSRTPRLDFEKTLSKIIDLVEARCKDKKLRNEILSCAEECQADARNVETRMEIEEQELLSPKSRRARVSARLAADFGGVDLNSP